MKVCSKLFGVVLCSLLVFGCSSKKTDPVTVEAPPKIEKSFRAIQPTEIGLDSRDHYFLGIQKAALEKEYFFHGSLIPQTKAATGSGLQARIVSFRKVGNVIHLLEATNGHVVTNDLPSQLLLASFPILKDMGDTLVIDFNKGMNKVYYARNWYASDGSGKRYKTRRDTYDVRESFIHRMLLENNKMEIRQIVTTKEESGIKGKSNNFEARYYLYPYKKNVHFRPKETSNFKHVGYFESAPILEESSGRSVVHISKWDDSKPIKFYISANTPKDYVEAVRSGILYWNKAFMREIVQAEVAPKGITAPDPHHNVVQWVPWDNAGFAYADMLMDPRTAEILHAQVYMTSVFAFASKNRVAKLLRKIKSKDFNLKTKVGHELLHTGRVCDFEIWESMESDLMEILARNPDEETLRRISQDYVRLVIAHEIGHTLGLRHNFASNLDGTFRSLSERRDHFWNYFKNDKVSSKRYNSTSVMEYQVFTDSIVGGAQIRKHQMLFPYDSVAIGWGYRNRDNKEYLFCTDTHVSKYVDCNRHDYGRNTAEYYQASLRSTLSSMPISVAEEYISAKTHPDPNRRHAFENVSLSPKNYVKRLIVNNYQPLIGMFKGKFHSLEIARSFPYVSSLNEKEYRQANDSWYHRNLSQFDALKDTVLFQYLPGVRKNKSITYGAIRKLREYLNNPSVQNGIGYDGKPYKLSQSEAEFILLQGTKFFTAVEEELIKEMVGALGKGNYKVGMLKGDAERLLEKVACKIVLDAHDSKRRFFKYDHELRLSAARLLNRKLGDYKDWSMAGRAKLKKKLTQIIERVIGKKISLIRVLDLPRKQRQWYLEQREILNLLK